MKFKVAIKNPWRRSAIGAALVVACGLLLWGADLGERWVNASYDYLFRFAEREVTNKVVLVMMDNEAYRTYGQKRGTKWDRSLHANLVNKLADEKCPLIVFDVWFKEASDDPADLELLSALRRLDKVALMAKQTGAEYSPSPTAQPILPSVRALLPAAEFMAAAKSNYGVPWVAPDRDIVRTHWPFPAREVQYPSLSWTAAKLAGAKLSDKPEDRWLRYYGREVPCSRLSYTNAFGQPKGFFSDKFVFIGNRPASTIPSQKEDDKFNTPHARWEDEAVGGVDIVATMFLNLLNHEWLRRPSTATEAGVVLLFGALLGGLLCHLRPLIALIAATGTALAVTFAAVTFSYVTNYWFPWLLIVGAQVPCALVWAWVTRPRTELSVQDLLESTWIPSMPEAEPVLDQALIEAADYEVVEPPFAQGSFGKVWLAKNAIGQWQALKTVYEARFGKDRTPYELEFKGISNYKPISDKHPGLLRVDFVSKPKLEGYFYYVMELGDPIADGWQTDPKSYKPRDLATQIKETPSHRLPVAECVRIVGLLAEALDFLHQQGFTHRDVKPSNIIFVKGRPKLADVGLVREIRPAAEVKTWAGTLGYMPPNEPPGTVQADIYSLGMVLYVISTGQQPAAFPQLSTTLAQTVEGPEFIRLNSVILKACEPDHTKRYATAAELCAALAEVQKMCGKSTAKQEGETRDPA